MQANVTVSPLDAWTFGGELTKMAETREGTGSETEERRSGLIWDMCRFTCLVVQEEMRGKGAEHRQMKTKGTQTDE